MGQRRASSSTSTTPTYTLLHLLETAYPRNLVTGMDHRGSPALGPRQDDIYQISRGRDGADRFEIVDRHVLFLFIYSTVAVGGTNKNTEMSGRKKYVLRRYNERFEDEFDGGLENFLDVGILDGALDGR